MRAVTLGTIRASSLLLLFVAVGCAAPATPPAATDPAAAGTTYVLHLPGVAGETSIDRWWLDALHQGGIGTKLEVYDWTCNDRGIDALHATARNHVQAQLIASRITRQVRRHPSTHVILTAVSGGTGVAVWALERLPRDVVIDQVVLVAPAFAPDYDLSAALRHVKGKAYAFTSPVDFIVLGFGTSVFGTIDGKYTEAAGFVGVQRPAHADVTQYQKLIELRYTPSWIRWGNLGDHTGAMSVAFAREYVAPLLEGRTLREQ